MAKQQPTAAYLRFCRVASINQPQAYYRALLQCANTGNNAVAKLQAKGFVFTVSNTKALVQQLLGGTAPRGTAALGQQGVLGVAAAYAYGVAKGMRPTITQW